jgi:hypothetical protein
VYCSQQNKDGAFFIFTILEESKMFTNGQCRAFELLMKEKPNADHYDSGSDGICAECRTCRFHRPYWIHQSSVFRECPYSPGTKTIIDKVK